MSTARLASATTPPCAACGAPLADDQRYCLACGEARAESRRPLPAALRRARRSETVAATATPPPATAAAAAGSPATALAGLACLLLAVAVGVLIGKGGGDPARAPAPITIAAAPGGAVGSPPAASAAFASDWPSGRDGWTVALRTLPKAQTDAAAVAAAKADAGRRGAPAVGALDSGDHPTLTAGSYVVYSGIFGSRAAAASALPGLTARFPGARVVEVAARASGGASSRRPGAGAKRGVPAASPNRRRPSAVSTKEAFERSKRAPKTVGTGGRPPPKDDKPAAAGGGFQDIG